MRCAVTVAKRSVVRPPGLHLEVAVGRAAKRCAPLLTATLLGVMALPGAAQEEASGDYAPDVAESGSVAAIARFTTSPAFLPETVSYVPDSSLVPSPTEVLGHLAGAPDELTGVARIHDYMRSLAAASERVEVDVLGASEEGREILLVRISDAANLARLDRLREITAQLADPRQTDRAAAEALIREGIPFYYLLGGLHSAETASPEMLMELAYRLAVSERPEIVAIRQRLVVLITPVVETDGRDRQVEWYYRHLRGRDLDYEALREFSTPPYWGRYVFHDNNRDGIQMTQALTRAVGEAYYSHHPQVMHDLHESVPLLYISTGHGPYSRAIDPVTIAEWGELAFSEASGLQALGLPGVWTWGFWDGWWPGYLVSVANNHHGIGRFYEAFGNSLAGTFERRLESSRFVGKPVTERQWYRPWPPDEKLTWSLRNTVNYMQAAVLEGLGHASADGEALLRNFWRKGERALRTGREQAPHAWIFPLAQRDARRLDYLVNRLLDHRIEVHALSEAFTTGETTYGVGSYVVRLDQPYGTAARTFLEAQEFPADEPNPPYDDIAWTWPLLYGVEGKRIDDPAVLSVAMRRVEEPVSTPGHVEGTGEIFLLRDTGQNGLFPAAVALRRHSVAASEEPFEHGGIQYPRGSWIVSAPAELVAEVAANEGLLWNAVLERPEVPTHELDFPRLAVLHTWTSTQDSGWLRYTFDQEEIPYTLINPDDLRAGDLGARFDVILFPSSRGDFARMVHGIDPAYGPLPYTETLAYPSHGRPDSSPDITGGMGFSGLANLQDFVIGGGVLVALGNSGTLAVAGGLVRRVSTVSQASFNSPGSEIQARVRDLRHPLTYGYEQVTSLFRGNLPLFDVGRRDREWIVLSYGSEELPALDEGAESAASEEEAGGEAGAAEAGEAGAEPAPTEEAESAKAGLVLSGYVRGEEVMRGKPAILDVPVGEGRVLIYSFNPLHRYLNHSDFRWLYNAILNWNDRPE